MAKKINYDAAGKKVSTYLLQQKRVIVTRTEDYYILTDGVLAVKIPTSLYEFCIKPNSALWRSISENTSYTIYKKEKEPRDTNFCEYIVTLCNSKEDLKSCVETGMSVNSAQVFVSDNTMIFINQQLTEIVKSLLGEELEWQSRRIPNNDLPPYIRTEEENYGMVALVMSMWDKDFHNYIEKVCQMGGYTYAKQN